MYVDEPRPRMGYQGSAVSRAKDFAMKVAVVLVGGLVLASAFVVSLVLVAVGTAVVLIGGGYLWWKTRELRRKLQARMRGQLQPVGEIIEGEVIEVETIWRDRTRR